MIKWIRQLENMRNSSSKYKSIKQVFFLAFDEIFNHKDNKTN